MGEEDPVIERREFFRPFKKVKIFTHFSKCKRVILDAAFMYSINEMMTTTTFPYILHYKHAYRQYHGQ